MQSKISVDIVYLSINLLLIIIVGYYAYLKDRQFILNVPEIDNLESIEIISDENDIFITDYFKIECILNVLDNKKTNKKSIKEKEYNKLYKISFIYKDIGVSSIYLYKKNNKYYIEQLNNGIYEINNDEYNKILSYEK